MKPRKLTPSASRRQIISVSTAFFFAFLCAFLVCLFLVDTQMLCRRDVSTSEPIYNLGQYSTHLSLTDLMNSAMDAGEEAVTREEEETVTYKEEEAVTREEEETVTYKAESTVIKDEEEELETKEEEKAGTFVIPAEDDEPEIIKMEPERKKNSLVGCDLSVGQWVYNNATYPLYRTRNCPFADPGFRCEENGRPDLDWMSYHWKPHGCDLPRFNATDILVRLRGQRMVFVGDSLGRNNWESMMCMLAEGVPDKSKIYEVNGEPITKHTGKLIYRFEDYNCTVEYYREPFLVPQTRPPRNSPSNVKCALRVDHVSWHVDMWKTADIIIFNVGHWWTEGKIFHHGCQFQVGNRLKPEYDLPTGFKTALHTWAGWLEKYLDAKKSQVFWMSFPTVHFRGGTWNHGGHCQQEHRPLTEEEARGEWQMPWMNQIVVDELMSKVKELPVTYLDITTATNYRADGHGSLYTWDTNKFGLKPRNRQDCSHFCLPGVPDAWNEIILASLFAQGKGTWET